MLRRLTSGVALASMAALVLVGCAPAERTDEEVLAEARTTFDGFFAAIDAANASGAIDPGDLEPYATPDIAAQWASDVQDTLDEGTISRGVLEIVDIRVLNRTDDTTSTEICTDGRGIETTLADGSVLEPSQFVAWSADFTARDGNLLLASLNPIQDQGICD